MSKGKNYWLSYEVVMELAESILPNSFFYNWIYNNKKSRNDLYAEVLAIRGHDKLSQYDINALTAWLEDMNWEGAFIIFNLLSSLPHEKLIIAVCKAYQLHRSSGHFDPEFIYNLIKLLKEAGISKDEFNDDVTWAEFNQLLDTVIIDSEFKLK